MKASLFYFLVVAFKCRSEAKLSSPSRSMDYVTTPSANKLGPLFYLEPPAEVYFSNDTGEIMLFTFNQFRN